VKSKEPKRGILSALSVALRWFWAPRKNPHAEEERADQRRREKRRRAAQTSSPATKARASKKAVKAPNEPDFAYVDKAGNVRLTDGGRTVARASKGSKSAALAEAAALYDVRCREVEALLDRLASTDSSVADLEPRVAQLKTDIRDAPGLGDLDALDLAFNALSGALETRAQEQWNRKRSIIAGLEALTKTAPSEVQQQTDQLSDEWAQAGSAGAVHDTVLERRYSAALEAAITRARLATDQPELYDAERQSVLNALIDLMASADRKSMGPRLDDLRSAWLEAGGSDDSVLHQQFTQMTAAIEHDIRSLESEKQDFRTALEQDATGLDEALDALIDDANALAEGRTLRALSKSLSAMEAKAAGSNRDLTDRLRRRVDELHWRADREVEKRRALVFTLAESARESLDSATHDPAQITSLKDWRRIEDATKSGLDSAQQALSKLKALGRIAADESASISTDLRSARKAFSDARKAFFETLDESRETNAFRKRALLDRLSHPPLGATVKELDTHVDQIMDEWKQAGSAGRDVDQTLWSDFQDLRAGIRGLRDEAAAAERDDFGARLAEAFTRKRELSYTIEDEIRMGKLVLEQKGDPKFEKELRRKERRLEGLRKDLSDIQRKLAKLSKTKNAAPSGQELEQPSDHAA